MLVPIVWFEESALIPEESAQKFRSLYIDRVRLLNWSLVSLLIASILLLLIDARLLITTRYWRQFKLIQVAPFQADPVSGPGGAQDRKAAKGANKGGKVVKPMAATGANGAKKASKFQPLGALVKLTSSCAGGGADSNKAGGGLGVCPLTSKRQVGANLPLLNHNSSSFSSSSSSTSSTTSSYNSDSGGARESLSTPPDSPELRKWSDNWNRQQPMTRVYLSHSQSQQTSGDPSNSAVTVGHQDQSRPRQAASTTKHRSVVELSSPAGRQAIDAASGAPEV